VGIWAFALIITMLLTVTNLFSVKNYGEFEFWFALIKVLAIIGFIILGLAAIFGFLPNSQVSGVSHLFDTARLPAKRHGRGVGCHSDHHVFLHGHRDRDHRGRGVERSWQANLQGHQFGDLADRLVLPRIDLHRCGPGAMERPDLASVGSYQTVLDRMGIPNAKMIVDIVVLVAVTSCLNSALYTSSRMLFSLGKRGDAPAVSTRTNKSGTPYWAVMLSTGAAFLATFANYVAPAAVFEFLLASSGAIALLVYLVIAISQLRMRKQRMARGEKIVFSMWLFPGLTYAVIAFIVAALTIMLFQDAHRVEILATGLLSLLVVAAGLLVARRRKLQKTGAVVLN
jgi:GABA permease